MFMGITWTHLESVWNPSGPLLHKAVTDQELFFVVSYSKPALGTKMFILTYAAAIFDCIIFVLTFT